MLQIGVDWLIYSLFGLNPESKLTGVIHFFIYDSIKILLLLVGMIFIVGILRTFISQDKIKEWLIQRKGMGNFYAAIFGAVTPFCSCSSIPIFLSFLKAGIPLGATFSFLITSPLINEYLVALMIGFFGWKITAAYVVSGIVIGVVSGIILGKMNLEKYIVADMLNTAPENNQSIGFNNYRSRIIFGFGEAKSIVQKIWGWVLVGVALGAVIHNYVPQESIGALMRKTGIFSVPLATLVGVPMYASCAAIIPVAVVLFQKGIPLGTALAFMMAVSALSLPEAVMLRRAMTLKLIAIFFGITSAAIILTGYFFNVLQKLLV